MKESDRGLTKKEIIEPHEKFRDLYDGSPDMIVSVLPKDGNILRCNETFLRKTGYTKDEIIGTPIFEMYHSDCTDDVAHAFKLFRKKGVIHNKDLIIKKKDGSKIDVSLSVNAIKDKAGKILYSISSLRDITDHKRSKRALRESEIKYRQITNQIPGMVFNFVLHPDGSFSIPFVSGRVFEYSGYRPEEIMADPSLFFKPIHPEDRQDIQTQIRVSAENLIEYSKEHRLITSGGETRWFHVKSSPRKLENGDIVWDGISIDITERKNLQQALKKSEEQYQTVSEITSDYSYAYRVEPNGEIINEWVTGALKRITGFTREEVLEKGGWESLIHPEDIQIPLGQLKSLFENQSKIVEYRIIDKAENIRWMRDFSKPIWDEKNDCLKQIYGAVQEFTKQKIAEDELRKSEERYRDYFEEDLSGSYISRPDGQLLKCNREYKRIFGFENDQQALATTIHKLFQNPGVRFDFLKRIKKEKRVTNFEPQLKKIDGTPVEVIENASGVFDENGNLKHIRGFLLDISEQKKLELRLQQSQKMEAIGTLAGGIAHDFNNILFPIMGHTEMLLEDITEDSPFHESLNEIYSGTLRAKDLVKQILTFSRQESGELKLMKMRPIIKEALKLIRSSIPSIIEIKHDIQTDCGLIKADPTKIHQIVMNLATNAYHAMEKTGGELKVILKKVELGEYDVITPDMIPGEYACLTVSDTGTGIDKVLTEKIFDPFFTTKAIGKGTGMGLSVIHGIVTNMGGTIRVYSEPGEGTEFKIYLPVEKNHVRKQVINSKAEIQLGTEHILLVDDEEAILLIEKKMLERLGYQVTSRSSSVEALEAFRANPDKFDVVVTDMAMPNISGDRLSVELNEIRSDIPILLCTGFSESMSEERAASLGIKGILLKPIVMKDLSKKIREVLDTNKTEEKN